MDFFDIIFKRVASFPVQSYDNNKTDLHSFFFNNELFKLSVLISSRSLYEDLKKNKSEKTKKSLEKYFSRAHFKPTPFGVFASVGNLKWNNSTLLRKSNSIQLKVGFDNLFLSKAINNLMAENWTSLTYCTNPSIHFLNKKKIGFYRSKIVTNTGNEIIETSYIEIDYDENIGWLIERFSNGGKMKQVIAELILEGFEKNETEQFLLEISEIGLIINHFLFYPYNSKLIKNNENHQSSLVNQTKYNLANNEDFINFSKSYKKEQDTFLKDNTSKYSHSIYSSDGNEGYLDIKIQDKIKKFIEFTINYNRHNTPFNEKLNKFRIELSNRFEDGFISITEIFNPNSGLEYSSITSDKKVELHHDILNKILSSDGNNILLSLPSFKLKNNNYGGLPATFSVMFENIKCKTTGKEVLFFKGLGGASAMNLISRFGEFSSDICNEIAEFEKSIHENKIVAEVNMISSLRGLNLLSSRQYYDYNIPINTTLKDVVNPILLSDIYIHLEGNSFTLMSKKHQKQILPKIISAINFSISDFEIYRFLSEIEFQNEEITAVNFNFNTYPGIFVPYVSRVYLEDDILLYGAQILLVYNSRKYDEFKVYLLEIIKKYSFSTKIIISDLKGEIIVDTANDNHVLLIFEKVKTNFYLYVSECLYESFDPQVENDSGNFSHEFIASIKNTQYVSKNINYSFQEFEKVNLAKIPLLNDWLYLEVYCNAYAENEILKYVYEEIILKNKFEKFFFVRYSNPKKHLRLRFKSNTRKINEFIIGKIHNLKITNVISKYYILPYSQEIYRYGGVKLMDISETIFSLDSDDTVKKLLCDNLEHHDIQITAILKINCFLNLFNLSLEDKIFFCQNFITLFSNEFELNPDLRKDFNKNYSKIKSELFMFEVEDFFTDSILKKSINDCLEKSSLNKYNYIGSLIHMSMNRLFSEKQRFNEFKAYYFAKCYFNQIKYTLNNKVLN